MGAPAVVAATHSHNTTLSYWNGSAYVALANVRNIKRGPTKVTSSNASTLASLSRTKEKTPGMIDEGGFTCTLVFRTAVAGILRGLLATTTAKAVNTNWAIQAPDGTTSTTGTSWTFDGFIMELSEEFPEDDTITQDVNVDISGPVTEVAAS